METISFYPNIFLFKGVNRCFTTHTKIAGWIRDFIFVKPFTGDHYEYW